MCQLLRLNHCCFSLMLVRLQMLSDMILVSSFISEFSKSFFCTFLRMTMVTLNFYSLDTSPVSSSVSSRRRCISPYAIIAFVMLSIPGNLMVSSDLITFYNSTHIVSILFPSFSCPSSSSFIPTWNVNI